MNILSSVAWPPTVAHDTRREGVRLGLILATATWLWLVLVDAVAGPQVGTDAIWKRAAHLPRLLIINKMDRENADYRSVLEILRERYGKGVLPLSFPIGTADGLTVDSDRPGSHISRLLATHDLWIDELVPVRQDLESYFLELTAHDTLGGPATDVA